MNVNDKSDIISDILRSFHKDTTARHQGEPRVEQIGCSAPSGRVSTKPERSNVPSCKNAKISG